MLVTEESCQPWALEAFFVSVTKITNQKSTLIEKSKCMNVVHIFFSYMGKVVVTR
nr:MAG TPA: hypothetical protein [Bacteriophage sp.]